MRLDTYAISETYQRFNGDVLYPNAGEALVRQDIFLQPTFLNELLVSLRVLPDHIELLLRPSILGELSVGLARAATVFLSPPDMEELGQAIKQQEAGRGPIAAWSVERSLAWNARAAAAIARPTRETEVARFAFEPMDRGHDRHTLGGLRLHVRSQGWRERAGDRACSLVTLQTFAPSGRDTKDRVEMTPGGAAQLSAHLVHLFRQVAPADAIDHVDRRLQAVLVTGRDPAPQGWVSTDYTTAAARGPDFDGGPEDVDDLLHPAGAGLRP